MPTYLKHYDMGYLYGVCHLIGWGVSRVIQRVGVWVSLPVGLPVALCRLSWGGVTRGEVRECLMR
jgi:hypothetical protein